MKNELEHVFREMEKEWHAPRNGAEQATQNSLERIKAGETVIFVYPWANPGVVDGIMRSSEASGQFDLPLYADSRLHVTKKANRLDLLALKD